MVNLPDRYTVWLRQTVQGSTGYGRGRYVERDHSREASIAGLGTFWKDVFSRMYEIGLV